MGRWRSSGARGPGPARLPASFVNGPLRTCGVSAAITHLQPTALVNEAYVRLMGQERVTWINRAQFFGVAAQAMRRILVDHARERAGGEASRRDPGDD